MKKLSIFQSLRKEHHRQPIDKASFENFKIALSKLFRNIKDGQREETQKEHLKMFLVESFYGNYYAASEEDIDLVVKTGSSFKNDSALLIEAKSTINRAEMITTNNLNGKALQELLYYYLHERELKGNINLKYMIVNNVYEFFIFDAHEFERKFYNNKVLLKKFHDFKDGRLSGNKTGFFYEKIASEYIAKAEENLECTHFDLRDYEKYLKDESKGTKKLEELYKIFSDTHLMKKPIRNDSNTLNQDFYNELLHIIGLQEIKVDNKPVIVRLQEEDRNSASLLENTIKQLSGLHWNTKATWKNYGETDDERVFNVALELCITWINRILFLKLLEGQLLKYHNGNSNYKFLSYEKIKDYDDLKRLFFDVLAKDYNIRDAEDIEGFENVPYLNSSLFEETKLEQTSLKISALSQRKDMPLYRKSVLLKSKKKIGVVEMNPLNYLFSFLDSYDFSGNSDGGVQREQKTLINASVLGLIFEKINGHKDGSVFTPGFITMYMCREAIVRTVLQKFNDCYGWCCKNITDLENQLDKITDKEANLVINSIHLCDPSVGSGHFLVSALNEMIRLKFELGILCDRNGKRIRRRDYNFTIDNDELIITEDNGKEFTYNPQNDESQRIQEMLFHEKKTIIENCLFGVDLNSNSVKICSLRLWIELLKNTYYTKESNYKHLETLPNIDINIKPGNSLVHRFDLNTNIKEVLRNTGISIKEYRNVVSQCKSASKDEKTKLDKMIDEIKQALHIEISNTDKRKVALKKKEVELSMMHMRLFDLNKAEKARTEILEKEVKELKAQIAEIESNKMFINAFEWRIEFPELLDDDGNFMGFDCVIGNPPYIRLQKMGTDSDSLGKLGYVTYDKTGDICTLFYEMGVNLLKENGSLFYITTNTWMRNQYGENLRRFLVEKASPNVLIDFQNFHVFDSVTVCTNLLFLQKKEYDGQTRVCAVDKKEISPKFMDNYFNRNQLVVTFKPNEIWTIHSSYALEIKRNVEAKGVPLSEWSVDIDFGIKTGKNTVFILENKEEKDDILNDCLTEEERVKTIEIIRPILRGKDIKKYSCSFADKWLINTHNGIKEKGMPRINIDDYPSLKHYLDSNYDKIENRSDKGDTPYNLRNCVYLEKFSQPKIVWGEISDKSKFYLDESGSYYCEATTFLMTGDNLWYILACLNSSIIEEYFACVGTKTGEGTLRWKKYKVLDIPIPPISDEVLKDRIVSLAKEIQRQNGKADDLIGELDSLIRGLYGF